MLRVYNSFIFQFFKIIVVNFVKVKMMNCVTQSLGFHFEEIIVGRKPTDVEMRDLFPKYCTGGQTWKELFQLMSFIQLNMN